MALVTCLPARVCRAASKEYSLRRALAKMKEVRGDLGHGNRPCAEQLPPFCWFSLASLQEWVGMEFHVSPYKDTGTAVIGQTDEITVCRLLLPCRL
jgi:hypothetical protein